MNIYGFHENRILKTSVIVTAFNQNRNMRKKEPKKIIPDISEFTDDSGRKWIQTSTDDLFSMRELNDIISSIEKEREKDEVVLARIDFQKVDREFYNAAVELQRRLQKQTRLMKEYIEQSTATIERKNRKLKELIEYIRKLHQFLAYLNTNPEYADQFNLKSFHPEPAEEETVLSEYEEVEEVIMPPDAE